MYVDWLMKQSETSWSPAFIRHHWYDFFFTLCASSCHCFCLVLILCYCTGRICMVVAWRGSVTCIFWHRYFMDWRGSWCVRSTSSGTIQGLSIMQTCFVWCRIPFWMSCMARLLCKLSTPIILRSCTEGDLHHGRIFSLKSSYETFSLFSVFLLSFWLVNCQCGLNGIDHLLSLYHKLFLPWDWLSSTMLRGFIGLDLWCWKFWIVSCALNPSSRILN